MMEKFVSPGNLEQALNAVRDYMDVRYYTKDEIQDLLSGGVLRIAAGSLSVRQPPPVPKGENPSMTDGVYGFITQ
jgi:hypothetical protein